MKTYRYLGLNEAGEPLEGTLRAQDKETAVRQAKEICRYLTKVAPVHNFSLRQILQTDVTQLLSGGKIPAKQLSLLCHQLAIGLEAGMPLTACLDLTMQNQTEPFLRQLLEDAAEDVRSGFSLADALETRNPQLPPVFTQSIRAGESTGTLADSFSRLAEHYHRQSTVADTVSSALVYPAMLLTVAIGVIVIILVYAVPVFEANFARMGSDLPAPTALVIRFSHFLTENGFLLVALVLGLLAGILTLYRDSRGRRVLDGILLRLPFLGEIHRMQAVSQLSMTLCSLLRAGLPLVDALQITAGTLQSPLLGDALDLAAEGLKDGRSLSQGLGGCSHFPHLLTALAATGEETGNLPRTLELASEYYRSQVDTALKRALGILEPCIILLLAGLVVFILLSVYLPIFGMYGSF